MEHTKLDYTSAMGSPATNSFIHFLPSFHAEYRIAENSNIRLAATQSINRPDYFELVPYSYTEDDDRFMGNPKLQLANASNYDLLFEHFLPKFAGIISGGFFYKKINDLIELIHREEQGVSIYQPQNSGTATISGFEVTFQNRLDFIGLRNIGVVLNYIYSDSKVELSTRKNRPLRGHSKHVANLALSYENPGIGFSGLIAVNFKGRQLEEVGETENEDIYETNYTRVDCKLSQKILPRVRFTVEGRNLTDVPFHLVLKDPIGVDQTVQREYYGRSILAGFNIEM